MSFISIVIGIFLGILVYVGGAAVLRKFWIAPPSEPDPANMKPVDLQYRCSVCGAEVTMTMAPSDELPEAPRHCREDMVLTTSN